jgi:hypothetical protein
VLRAEPDVDAQDVEDGGPLGDHVRDVTGHGSDRCSALGERVGGREPGHAETDDENAQAGPVGVPVREPGPGLVGGIEDHCVPTTHSA